MGGRARDWVGERTGGWASGPAGAQKTHTEVGLII